MKLKGIKIVSDGTIWGGTKIYSNEGEDLTSKLCIKSVEWKHDAGTIPTAILTCQLAEVELLNVDAGIVTDPPKVKRKPAKFDYLTE